MGAAPEKVVAVVLEPVADRIEGLKARAERLELEPDPETVRELREGLAERWREVEEKAV